MELPPPDASAERQLEAMVTAFNQFYDRSREMWRRGERDADGDECHFFSRLAVAVGVKPRQLFATWDPVAVRGLLCMGAHGSKVTVLIIRVEDMRDIMKATRDATGEAAGSRPTCGPGATPLDLTGIVPKLDPWVTSNASVGTGEQWRGVTKERWRRGAQLSEANARWLTETCDTSRWYR